MGESERDPRTSLFALLAALLLGLLAAQTALAGPLGYRVQELLPLPGDDYVGAQSLNAHGDVVGYSHYVGGPVNAVFWRDGTAHNLSSNTEPAIAFVANDINDAGQIVGTGSNCFGFVADDACLFLSAEEFGIFQPAQAVGAFAWLAPGSTASLPLLPGYCRTDRLANAIDNLGYTYDGAFYSLRSANIETEPLSCNPFLAWSLLIGNGITALSDGSFLNDPIVDFFYDTEAGVIEALGGHQWVIVPTCTGDEPAHLLSSDFFVVSDDIKASICNLAATGYVRNRFMNASGQYIENRDGRAFLYTPVPEPATLALLAIALVGLCFSRRRRLH